MKFCLPCFSSKKRRDALSDLAYDEYPKPHLSVSKERLSTASNAHLSLSKEYGSDFSSSPRDSRVSSFSSKQASVTSERKPSSTTSSYYRSSQCIQLSACRWCSDAFEYSLDDGTVTILTGVPPKGTRYKAVSHVWGETMSMQLNCLKCRNVTNIAMSSAAKFHLIMKLAGPGTNLWLDVLSIDHLEPTEVATIMSSMGSIYSNAQSVLVLLPSSDEEAYHTLARIAHTGSILLSFYQSFVDNQEQSLIRASRTSRLSTSLSLGALSEEFWNLISDFEENLLQYVYWRRAWTVQEWTAARDIDVAYEHNHLVLQGSNHKTLEGVKSIAQRAAYLLITYKRKHQRRSTIMFGLSRNEVLARHDACKRLFPEIDSNGFQKEEEEEDPDVAFLKLLERLTTDCLREDLLDRDFEGADALKARLKLALDAYHMSGRETRFLVDHVNCWAAMCDIESDYGTTDRPAFALQKVMTEVRRRGVRVFNWLVNTEGASAQVDTSLLDYAQPHWQCNAPSNEEIAFPGLPIFTGRADTVTHLRLAVEQPLSRPSLLGFGVGLKQVADAQIHTVTELTDSLGVCREFILAVFGNVHGTDFANVNTKIVEYIRGKDRADLESRYLAIVRIPVDPSQSSGSFVELTSWAVMGWNESWKDLFVAREELNGTLVLAATTYSGSVQVAAYLTISDQKTGTYLLPTDEDGRIHITLDEPGRPKELARTFQAKVHLEAHAPRSLAY